MLFLSVKKINNTKSYRREVDMFTDMSLFDRLTMAMITLVVYIVMDKTTMWILVRQAARVQQVPSVEHMHYYYIWSFLEYATSIMFVVYISGFQSFPLAALIGLVASTIISLWARNSMRERFIDATKKLQSARV
jgi:hypothetical protein